MRIHTIRPPICWTLVVGIGVGIFLASTLSVGLAWQAGRPPFRDAGEQREQMIRELQEIKALLRQQNDLLRQLAPKGNSL